MILLDTNVLSELMRPAPAASVVRFTDGLATGSFGTTAVCVQEIVFGIELLGETARAIRDEFESLLDGPLSTVLPLTEYSAHITGVALAERRRRGHALSTTDAQIAGIAIEHGATLATRNVRDFAGMPLEVVDPWLA